MKTSEQDSTADIVDLFLACAAKAPDHLAIATSFEKVTYSQFEQRVRAYANLFSSRPEPKVLFALPPSVAAYACVFAAALAGGFHTPVHVGSPSVKVEKILAQLQPDFVIASPPLVEVLRNLAPSAIVVTPDAIDLSQTFRGRGHRNSLAYVFFTSGSTGEPKGVMVSRRALGTYVSWLQTFGITSTDRVSQHPNLAFDISMTDIFGALCYGATLYPLDLEGDRLAPARFIRRCGITVWNSTPSVINLMMQGRQVTSANLGSVRLFNFCGEALLREHLDVLFSAVPEAIIQNTYGPTEATIAVTALPMNRSDYTRYCRASVALGDPLPGTEILLVNEPTERPDEGEIVLVGPQLAEGYWQDRLKTQSRFRPISSTDVRRGYFTGDWGERKPEGLFFRERIDFQVKVRGHRIELDEVAAAVRSFGYAVVCIFKRRDALAALVEKPIPDADVDVAELRRALLTRLDNYAVPQWIVAVDHIPRNENHKLDRSAAAALLEARLGDPHG